jgi:hypothetical protein
MLVSHNTPEKPGKQEQEKLLKPSVQVAPFKQGLEVHSLISVWHNIPEKPGKQVQEKAFTASTQVAELRQGFEAHSSILV